MIKNVSVRRLLKDMLENFEKYSKTFKLLKSGTFKCRKIFTFYIKID